MLACRGRLTSVRAVGPQSRDDTGKPSVIVGLMFHTSVQSNKSTRSWCYPRASTWTVSALGDVILFPILAGAASASSA